MEDILIKKVELPLVMEKEILTEKQIKIFSDIINQKENEYKANDKKIADDIYKQLLEQEKLN